MADDEQNRSAPEGEGQEGDAYGYEDEVRKRQAATFDKLSEEDHERLAETVEERVGREEEREDQGRGRAFSKDQIIHEAAIMVRGMYGTPKFKLELDDSEELGAGNYLQRTEEAGYYDLVDCWAVASHRLDLKYHSEFLKRATVLKWGSRKNRYLIPNYYVFGMKGVDRAVNQEYISPLFSHKLKYKFAVHFSLPFAVIGPPVAYFDWLPVGPSQAEALALAKLEEGEGESTALGEQAERLQEKARELREKKEEWERRDQEVESAIKKLQRAMKDDQMDAEKYRDAVREAKLSRRQVKHDLEDLYDDYQELKREVGTENA